MIRMVGSMEARRVLRLLALLLAAALVLSMVAMDDADAKKKKKKGKTLVGTESSETLTGTKYADKITGKEGDDTTVGQGGSDMYFYQDGWGVDTVQDTGGSDTLNFSGATTPVIAYLCPAIGYGYTYDGAGNWVAYPESNIENAVTGSGSDGYLIGCGENNRLEGRAAYNALSDLGGDPYSEELLPVSNDTFVAKRTDAFTYVFDLNDTDLLDMSSMNSGAVEFLRSDDNLVMLTGEGTGVVVYGYFYSDETIDFAIEKIKFKNKTLTPSQVEDIVQVPLSAQSSAAAEKLAGLRRLLFGAAGRAGGEGAEGSRGAAQVVADASKS